MGEEQKYLEYLKRVTADLRRTRRQLQVAEMREREPIAIVAMACRYPGGVSSPADLWRLVTRGGDAITGFPEDRGWPAGSGYADEGGFVDGVAEFDAALFGISPREALAMDPQQRLLLESAWEVVERAGIDPRSLSGNRVGVFVGASASGYAEGAHSLPEGAATHLAIGNAASVVSGRVAYALGLEGPAVTVDTACSSSLVALHLAVHALRAGDCELALAGGVTVMSSPSVFAEFSRLDGLAGNGRCKAFAEGADGTGWGEGVGLLMVERLSDAQRLGHPVLAVVRGSAVNQDGASNGLTAPNGPSQQRVIRQALAGAGLSPADVDAVEAHGTGTRLGDPIEAQALLATYGRERAEGGPLWLGSVKSNIGHTQAAAGVAGVIKMVQAIHHGLLPATLHVDAPTSHVDWSEGGVELLTEARSWPETDHPRRAGVSSFGISGTNAHVIIEAAPAPAEPQAEGEGEAGPDADAEPTAQVSQASQADPAPSAPSAPSAPAPAAGRPALWPLSGKGAAGLRAQAGRLRAHLAETEAPDPVDLAWSLATTRAGLDHRAVVLGDLLPGLDALAGGDPATAVTGVVGEGRCAFLFTGQGSQRAAMGRGLYEAFPAFAEAFDAVCAELDRHLDGSVKEAVFTGRGLDLTMWTQAGLFAVEVAGFRLLESWGVAPDFLLGHSVGELAAAHCAGVLTLADACAVVAARGRLMQALPSGGAMLAVRATEAEAVEAIAGRADVAAVNGPSSVVVSGTAEVIDELAARWAAEGRRTSRLTVSHAFHSALMEPMLADFRAVLETVSFARPRIAIVSNLTGAVAAPDLLTTPEYWVRHVREAVRFADGAACLAARGVTRFVELGPDGVLCGMAQQAGAEGVFAPVLRRDRDDAESALTALARIWTAGVEVDWRTVLPEGRRVELPTYAFQRERYWPQSMAAPVGPPREASDQDVRFWAAVERADLTELATTLKLEEAPGLLDEVVPALAAWRRSQRQESTVDSWRYQVTWKPLTGLGDTAPLTGDWLLSADPGDGRAEAVEQALRAAGATVLRCAPGAWPTAGPAGVVGVVALPAGADPAAEALAAVQGLGEAGIDAPLWLLTSGAVSVGRFDPPSDPSAARVWGLGRVAALELPDRWGGLIDLPATLDARAGARLAAVLAGATGEDQVAVRGSAAYGRRLTRPEPTRTAERPWTPSGTVLVTGGTGALGAAVARWLAERGAPHLLLLARRGAAAPGAEDLVAELTATGTRVTVEACDVADREALAAVLARIPADLPLTGVVHAAGVAAHGPIEELRPADLAAVVDGKAAGAAHLDELTDGLDLFVTFSSIAATWGSGGQAAYAAGNAHLDALVDNRRSRGLSGTSIAWGPWAEAGMAVRGEAADFLRRRGLNALDPALAVRALARAVDHGEGCVTVADVDWGLFAPAFTLGRPSPLLADLPEAAQPVEGESSDFELGTALRQRLTAGPAGQRHQVLVDLVRERAAAVLGHRTAEAVDPEQVFRDLGFDSLTAVELRNLLNAETGLRLPATLVFDHPTPTALAGYLLGELFDEPDAPAAPTRAAADAVDADDDPVVIVGMSCRYPGGVESPDDLWRLVSDGEDGVTGFPADRGWDLADDEGSYARQGGFVAGATGFDAALFGISPREALAMDPQQRLLLEAAWEVLESAGLDPRSVQGAQIGVFAGASNSGYGTGGLGLAGAEGHLLSGTANSVISGRVAYTFGLEGPAVTVDTACSSSLVALHLAVQAVQRGECEQALAGGVTVMVSPAAFGEFDRQGGLSSTGRCRSYAGAADGTGWGEGVGLLLIERLSTARREGHRVHAVIRGSAVNQDGASNGLTAPNGPAQQRVIRQALVNAGLSTRDVDLVEGHGTGTVLGDPIEVQALLATYGQGRPEDGPLLLGSIKSNIGHTQAAAGAAGVIKMVQALRHGIMPATLHVDEPSPQVDWSRGAVELLTEARSWPELDRPRRAAVSSFGISGTNAHVIIEQPPAVEAERAPTPALALLPLSAHTRDGLRAQAQRLRTFLADSDADPRDTGHALATTRAALEHRAVLVGDDRTELLGRLADFDGTTAATAVPGGTAFLFTGQGAQRAGMAEELYARFPVFADAFDAVCAELDPALDRPVREVAADGVDLNLTGYAQTALFAVEVATFRLLESWGVVPNLLLGHSIGEVAAAHCAGVFSLADACRLVAARARLMQALPSGGAMLAVRAEEAEVREVLAGRADVAAVNGPADLVVSGEAAVIDELAARWRAEGRRTARLAVSHAFHSALMEPMLADFRAVLETITFEAPRIAIVSNLTGALAGADTLGTPDYWVRHVRETVRFADGVACLREHGVRRFIELGPDGVLCGMAQLTVTDGVFVPMQRRDRTGAEAVAETVGALWTAGVALDWRAVLGGGRRVELPTYAFQRERYWPEPGPVPAPANGAVDALDARFWDAVERADLGELASTLAVESAGELEPLLPVLSSWRRRRRADAVVNSWRYRVTWKPVTDGLGAGALTGTWLVVLPDGADGAAGADGAGEAAGPAGGLPAALRAAGAELVEFRCDPVAEGRAALAGRLAELPAEYAGVLSLTALGPDGLTASVVLLQALGDAAIGAPLWTVTSGAVSVGGSDPLRDPLQAQVWGAGRVAALEHPDRWGGLVDVPAAVDGRVAARLASVLTGDQGLDQVAVRPAGVYSRRLVRAAVEDVPAEPWTPSGTVLVTGGTGALGAEVARWLAGRGVPRLVLTSRRGSAAEGVDALVAELTGLGARVTVAACDAADRAALAAVLDAIPAEFPLTGVVHAAGVAETAPLDWTGPADVRSSTGGKVTGAAHLDELTAGLDLDLFVTFSSIAGVWGSGGQGLYAAANAYLDALVQQRRSRGLAGLSVAWGPWAEAGMAVRGEAEDFLRKRGLPALDPKLAVTALAGAVDRRETCAVVADVDWERFAPAFTSSRPSPLLADLPEAAQRPAAEEPATEGGTALVRRLAAAPVPQRGRILLDLVRARAATVLGHGTAEAVGADRAFRDLGFTSLTAVELRNALGTETGLALPATLVFDHPTPSELAEHLAGELLDDLDGPDGPEAAPEAVRVDGGAAPGTDDPIVIVGMSCRYPGGIASPNELWELVATGADGISGFPVDRGWAFADAEDSYARQGGFVAGATRFDAGLFGISPREALAMDPQQRLLLEAAWEAFESAELDPRSMRGRQIGVFVGASSSGYGGGGAHGFEGAEGHLLSGTANSVISGRVAYSFGLEGPAVTVDTACSSSLVALHLAAQAVQRGECAMALAGGVTVMVSPATFGEFDRQGGLASDGRCKAFAAAADGTGWGEGVGVLLVERLSDARRLGHRVLARVRGSAVNQDGASNGLTAPNGPAQERVIRQALATAGLTAADVDVVEAHGTGTRLGDPIEAQALLATYGQGRPEGSPLLLGSIKSNIGHTQAAAGVAGIIKMVMAMRHGVLPATLHVDEPTPHVDWSAGAVELLTQARPWPEDGRPRRAGVSSFGISGTNAHVIIEAVPSPAPAERTAAAPPVVPWLLSGRTEPALRAQAERLAAFLGSGDGADGRPQPDPADLGHALLGRAALAHRAVVLGADAADLAEGLDTVTTGTPSAHVVAGATVEGQTAFLFTGQGAQRVGMGRGLYEAFPVFAAAFDAVCAELDLLLDRPVGDVVFDGVEDLDRTVWAQAGLFAVEVASYRLLESCGVVPDFLLGHSIGEIAAAHCAGVFSLPDACALVAARGRLMDVLPSGGAMLAVEAAEAEVRSEIGDRLDVAAVNGPTSVVVSGPAEVVEEFAARWKAEGRRIRRLTVSHAFHSALMEPMLSEFASVLAGLTFAEPRVPIVSNLTGGIAEPGLLTTPDYWVRQVREAVRFADGVAHLDGQGVTRYVELGPDGVLSGLAQQSVPEGVFAPVARRDREDVDTALRALARLWVAGADVDWRAVLPAGRRLELPTYAFQHERYWPEAVPPAGDPGTVGLEPVGHPLLSAAVQLAGDNGLLLTGRLSVATHPWLADHVILDRVVVPGAALVEMVWAAGRRAGSPAIRELVLRTPLVLPEHAGVQIQVSVSAAGDTGERTVEVYSRPEGTGDAVWISHAAGLLADEAAAADAAPDLTVWPPAGATALPLEGFYEALAEVGYGYGPVFRGLGAAWRVGETVCAEVALPEAVAGEAGGFGLHPALLDAALHAVGLSPVAQAGGTRLPFAWTSARLDAVGASVLRVRVEGTADGVSLLLADGVGEPVATVASLAMREVSAEALRPVGEGGPEALFAVDWVPVPVPVSAGPEGAGSSEWVAIGEVAGVRGFVDVAGLVGELEAGGLAVPPVVVLPVPVEGDVYALTARVLGVVQEWLAEERFGSSRLVVLTCGAVAVPAGGGADPVQAAVWGLLRSAQTENPDRIVLVDLDPDALDGSEGLWPAVVAGGEPQAAIRGGEVSVPRLVRASSLQLAETPVELDADGTVLITGGTGTLGGLLARHLAAVHGVRHLTLLSRRGADSPAVSELLADLGELGAEAEVVACDAADRTALSRVLDGLARPLAGVVHAAGVLD
ncbi:type I polyketide synthase, partial [Kitasatospora sp. NPDC058048]|uniref:type I polyketide synthase n=1 Tax=Kitasatospora sp. NPDC058048 TaxID=3346313 RepID=UPI0036DED012